ncbi:MAG: alpha/beta fold hydrolase, partial [Clostridia bacterium]|nr:alpha/beta fold hydrolase [Clostridia bacterium]
WKLILIILIVLLLLVFAVAFPIVSVSVYDSIFKVRIQTPPHVVFTADDYDGLTVETVSFATKQGHTLAGYKYDHETTDTPKGVVVLAHGFGGGGHCGYMPVIACFAENGYAVFSYDATGNDASEGEYIGGFPQGVIDLDYAINYVKADADYSGLPIFLVGHSWGAYSVGNVLTFQTDISGAALFAGFNQSKLLIRQTGYDYVGGLVDLMVPYVQAYEWIKYGKYATTSANEGFTAASDAKIMVIHSTDDRTVMQENGYDLFYEEHSDNDRVTFVLYEDRGHDYLFYTNETMEYRAGIDAGYADYIAENGLDDNNDSRAAYRSETFDYTLYYQLDDALMGQILAMFDAAAAGN